MCLKNHQSPFYLDGQPVTQDGYWEQKPKKKAKKSCRGRSTHSVIITFFINKSQINDIGVRVWETFELNKLKSAPSQLLPVNLFPFIWTGQYPILFSQVPPNFFFHCNDNQPRTWALINKHVFQCSKIMKCNNEAKASLVRHSPNCYCTSIQRTNNLNPRWIKPDEIRLFHNLSG